MFIKMKIKENKKKEKVAKLFDFNKLTKKTKQTLQG